MALRSEIEDTLSKYLFAPLVVVFCLTAFNAPAQCLKYESDNVELVGTIYSKVFAGPPNYESVKAGDEKEIATILKLKTAICTRSEGDANSFSVAESNVRRIQLVIGEAEFWRAIRQNRGRSFRVKGSLFHSHTGHHRTRVLLTVSDLKAL